MALPRSLRLLRFPTINYLNKMITFVGGVWTIRDPILMFRERYTMAIGAAREFGGGAGDAATTAGGGGLDDPREQ